MKIYCHTFWQKFRENNGFTKERTQYSVENTVWKLQKFFPIFEFFRQIVFENLPVLPEKNCYFQGFMMLLFRLFAKWKMIIRSSILILDF